MFNKITIATAALVLVGSASAGLAQSRWDGSKIGNSFNDRDYTAKFAPITLGEVGKGGKPWNGADPGNSFNSRDYAKPQR